MYIQKYVYFTCDNDNSLGCKNENNNNKPCESRISLPTPPPEPSDETALLTSTHSSWSKADWKKPSTPTLQKTYPGTYCLMLHT